jgi:hypothetical protein
MLRVLCVCIYSDSLFRPLAIYLLPKKEPILANAHHNGVLAAELCQLALNGRVKQKALAKLISSLGHTLKISKRITAYNY